MANKKYDKIGDKIFELRKVKDMSQDDLAKKVGVSRQAIMKWEANQVNPKADKLQCICDALDVSPDDLLSQEAQTEDEAEVVCDEATSQEDNVKRGKKNKRKLSKRARIAIASTVIAIVLIVGIILIVIQNYIISPNLEGSFNDEASSVYWSFKVGDIGWIIFTITMAVAVVLGIFLICRYVKKKKNTKN